MPANTAQLDASNGSDRPRKAAGKLRLLTLDDLDGRTTGKKSADALTAALTEELKLAGNNLIATKAVERAAAMAALAEDLRTRRLAGDQTVSLEDVVRVDAAADRAMRRLGIKPVAASKPRIPLHDRLLAKIQAAPTAVDEDAPTDSEPATAPEATGE
jgi:hypothetical protein